MKVPRYATSTTTAAITAGATSFAVTDATGIQLPTPRRSWTELRPSPGLHARGNTVTITTAGGAPFAHAAGVTVEFPFPAGTPPTGVANTLSVNNGTNTETRRPCRSTKATRSRWLHRTPLHSYTASGTGATLATLDPGTYSINAYLPGFGFTTGAAVSFQSFTTGGVADNDGVTGTVTVVNGNTATLNVTVPKIRSGDTGDHLTVSAISWPERDHVELGREHLGRGSPEHPRR